MSKKSHRIEFVDELRGFAVLAMFCWHTLDAWLLPTRKSGVGWDMLHLLGGMAAPLFLILAGVSVGLSLAKAARSDNLTSTRAVLLMRGGIIVLCGYALRLGLWCIDGGALLRSGMFWAWVPLLSGLLFGIASLKHAIHYRRRALLLCAIGMLAWGFGVIMLNRVSPKSASGLFRVDVLQAIGVSIALCSQLVRPSRSAIIKLVAAALTVTLLGTTVRELVLYLMDVGFSPVLVAYLGKWSATGQAISMFPLFPWLAYALSGAAFGLWLDARTTEDGLVWKMFFLGAAGALLAMCSSEGLPFIHRVSKANPWTLDTVRLGYRLGLALICASSFYLIKRHVFMGKSSFMKTLGCTSLLMYCAHLPLVFGVMSKPIKRSLDYPQLLLSVTLLCVAMWLLAKFRLRFLSKLAAVLMTPVVRQASNPH